MLKQKTFLVLILLFSLSLGISSCAQSDFNLFNSKSAERNNWDSDNLQKDEECKATQAMNKEIASFDSAEAGPEFDINRSAYPQDAIPASLESSKSDSKSGENDNKIVPSKIIYSYFLSYRTNNFDEIKAFIESQVEQVKGFYDDMMLDSNDRSKLKQRDLSCELRIPTAKVEEFIESLNNKIGQADHFNKSSENVTTEYYDHKRRIKYLKGEQSAYKKLLDNARELKDVMELTSKITELQSQIEGMETRIRTIDSLVEYTRVSLRLLEVIDKEVVEASTAKDTFSTRAYKAWNALKINAIKFVEDSAIWFIDNLLTIGLVILGLLFLMIIVKGMRRSRFKRRLRHEKELDESRLERIKKFHNENPDIPINQAVGAVDRNNAQNGLQYATYSATTMPVPVQNQAMQPSGASQTVSRGNAKISVNANPGDSVQIITGEYPARDDFKEAGADSTEEDRK